MKFYTKNTFILVPLFLILIVGTSCSTTKKIRYFEDLPDSGILKSIQGAVYTEPKIQPDDIITVVVQTADPLATQTINMGNIASASPGNMVGTQAVNQPTLGYLVDNNGFIEMAVLGKVKVAGYTTSEAKDIIKNLAARDNAYRNPTVIVRFANFKVSVAGEVNKPGTYIMPNERVSVLDALAMAGDLTIYGKRENVLLLRTNPDGTKMPYRINLQKSDIMKEPYFYLRQNDYVYIEPTKAKAAANDFAQAKNITILSSILSVIIILASRL